MGNPLPRVSVGLAVYNGENFIREAIDSILAQTFKDFELIISDNASTDKTQEICLEYAAKDKRIRYSRNEHNIGGIANQNRTVELSRGEYYKLAAHDDVCAPEFLEKCVEALDRDSSIVLSYPRTKIIDENGQFFDSDEPYVKLTNRNISLKSDSLKPQERFHDLACFPHACYQIFGVIRASSLKSIPGWGRYAGSDRALIARLGILGRFYEVPEDLFFLRRHSGQSINIGLRSMYLYNFWFTTANKNKVVLPHWERVLEYLSAISKAPLSPQDRMGCYLKMFNVLQVEGQGMIKDLIVATIQISERFYRRLFQRFNPRLAMREDTLIFNKIPRLQIPS
ncbi:MAG: glycosyltransferase family 2 protein [Kovacikia sp.]